MKRFQVLNKMTEKLYKDYNDIYFFKLEDYGSLGLYRWSIKDAFKKQSIDLPKKAVEQLTELLQIDKSKVYLNDLIKRFNRFYEGLTQGSFEITELEKLLEELDAIVD